MCLPCKIAHNEISRHCILCRPCLMNWIELATNKVECPKCRQQFDKNQLIEALHEGYLTFPENAVRMHDYKEWKDSETPRKRRCLEKLRDVQPIVNTVLRRDAIITNLPIVCNKILHMLGTDDHMVKLELIALQKGCFVPAPEKYEQKWNLQYSVQACL